MNSLLYNLFLFRRNNRLPGILNPNQTNVSFFLFQQEWSQSRSEFFTHSKIQSNNFKGNNVVWDILYEGVFMNGHLICRGVEGLGCDHVVVSRVCRLQPPRCYHRYRAIICFLQRNITNIYKEQFV